MPGNNDPAVRAIAILTMVAITATVTLFFSLGWFALRWWQWWRERERQAAREADHAALLELLSEQERVDLAAHRLLALADTLPPMPTLSASLPTVLPASYLDYSDSSDDTIIYCPICALEGIRVSGLRDADGYYPLPRGKRALCSEHTVRWERRIEGDVL